MMKRVSWRQAVLMLIALLGRAPTQRAMAQDLPAAPVFEGGDDMCGKGGVVYQPASNSFTLSYDAAAPADGFRQYRFHIEGGVKGALDALDQLPVKGITTKSLEVGPGKTVDLDLTTVKLIYGRLHAYDEQGRESEPAPIALVPLAPPPGIPVVGGGQTPTLSWQPTVLPSGLSPAPMVSYQVFRFLCTDTDLCGTKPGVWMSEQAGTTFNLPDSKLYRYAVRAVARFDDGTPPVFSQPSISAPCSCDPIPVNLTVTGLGSPATPSSKFTLPQPITLTAFIGATGLLCWRTDGGCQQGDINVGPGGAPLGVCDDENDCNLDLPGLNHAAFYYRIGSGGSPQTGSTISSQPAGTEIFLFVNDGHPENNSGGFTVNLSYTSQPQCGSR